MEMADLNLKLKLINDSSDADRYQQMENLVMQIMNQTKESIGGMCKAEADQWVQDKILTNLNEELTKTEGVIYRVGQITRDAQKRIQLVSETCQQFAEEQKKYREEKEKEFESSLDIKHKVEEETAPPQIDGRNEVEVLQESKVKIQSQIKQSIDIWEKQIQEKDENLKSLKEDVGVKVNGQINQIQLAIVKYQEENQRMKKEIPLQK